jgi:hypothetical protein
MQTFLVYPEFQKAVQCLDSQRLGKQRVEAKQIRNALDYGGGWDGHPAVNMWRGYGNALDYYYNCCLDEFIRRGYRNFMPYAQVNLPVCLPPWVGNSQFHASHRSNLLRKFYHWYRRFGWRESNDLPYVWPELLDEVRWLPRMI